MHKLGVSNIWLLLVCQPFCLCHGSTVNIFGYFLELYILSYANYKSTVGRSLNVDNFCIIQGDLCHSVALWWLTINMAVVVLIFFVIQFIVPHTVSLYVSMSFLAWYSTSWCLSPCRCWHYTGHHLFVSLKFWIICRTFSINWTHTTVFLQIESICYIMSSDTCKTSCDSAMGIVKS